MKSICTFAIAFIALAMLSPTSAATTTIGMAGDGMTSLSYNATTGEMRIQPDQMPVGLFHILSASGILTGNATFPPGGSCLLELCGPHEIAWAALPASAIGSDFSLGMVANPGLTLPF